MTTTEVTFDTRSGRILGVHHGATSATEAQGGAKYYGHPDAKISDEHVAVITVPSDAVEAGKQYTVDLSRKTLVATGGQDGVGFGFGLTARSS